MFTKLEYLILNHRFRRQHFGTTSLPGSSTADLQTAGHDDGGSNRGSTGFGRVYRDRLQLNWGVAANLQRCLDAELAFYAIEVFRTGLTF